MDDLIYLDNSATTKPFPDVIQEMDEYMKNEYGNPSALYSLGLNAEKRIKTSEMDIKNILHGDGNIYFTSGGTESNNLAIRGSVRSNVKIKKNIVTTKIEHPSVLEVYKYLQKNGYDVTYLDVDKNGYISLEQLSDSVNEGTEIVSIMHVNNEVGAVQDINKIGTIIKNKNPNTLFHVDGVQAFCRVPVKVNDYKVDLYSLSGHKIHGPKGIGALYVSKNVKLKAIVFGGGQQKGIRSGTENVPGIAGIGKAAEIYNDNMKKFIENMYNFKIKLTDAVKSSIDDIVINGPDPKDGAPHIVNISFLGVRGEVLLHALESRNIIVSTGSACSSRSRKISHVLSAMGIPGDIAESALRFSLSPLNNEDQIDRIVTALKSSVNELRRFRRR